MARASYKQGERLDVRTNAQALLSISKRETNNKYIHLVIGVKIRVKNTKFHNDFSNPISFAR